MSLVAFNGVSFAYGPDRAVLNELSFELEPGERLGLNGPNGCGKTTILRLIMGLIRPDAGDVIVFNQSRRTESDFIDVRRGIGFLFQDSDDQLFCPTVFEDVAFGPTNLGLPHREVHSVVRRTLESVGIAHLENRITYQLSHGQKRLVALATILAMEPKVLLLDEPTTGLDETHEARLTGVLLGLPQEMILVSHNERFLEQIATRRLQLGHRPPVEVA